MGNKTYSFSVEALQNPSLSFEKRGTYEVHGNLLFIKTEDGTEYINSFYFDPNIGCDFVDRESFLPKFEFVRFTFDKVSEKFPKD